MAKGGAKGKTKSKNQSEKRKAEDSRMYTEAQFKEYFGAKEGGKQWAWAAACAPEAKAKAKVKVKVKAKAGGGGRPQPKANAGMCCLAASLQALASKPPKGVDDFINASDPSCMDALLAGNIFSYMDALLTGQRALTHDCERDEDQPLSLWPVPEQQRLLEKANEAATAKLQALSSKVAKFMREMSQRHQSFEEDRAALAAQHMLGDRDAFLRPEVIVVLGCVKRGETDLRVKKAVAYARAVGRASQDRQPVFLASGKGFWHRATVEAVEAETAEKRQSWARLTYKEFLETGRAPTEAKYIEEKLLEEMEVDSAANILLNEDALDTVGNALFDYLTLMKEGVFQAGDHERRVVIVTSEYHTLRAFNFYRRVFPLGTRLAAVAADTQQPPPALERQVSRTAPRMEGPQADGMTESIDPQLPELSVQGQPPTPPPFPRFSRVERIRTMDATEEGKKINTSFHQLFEIRGLHGDVAELPVGKPLDLLFQLFKPKALNGHGLYNGDCKTGPVDFESTPPHALLKSYINKYKDQLV